MLTQNRQGQAAPFMPPSVKQQGVVVKKSLSFPMMLFTLTSTNPKYDSRFLNNYANINIVDALARIRGVGEVSLFGGSDYAMRIWLKPGVMSKMGVTVDDVKNALNAQNMISPGGKFGIFPAFQLLSAVELPIHFYEPLQPPALLHIDPGEAIGQGLERVLLKLWHRLKGQLRDLQN